MTQPPDQRPELAPSAFQSAGSDADLREAYLADQVETRRRAADELMASARDAVADASGAVRTGDAEASARRALAFYRGALDWAEDTDREDDAHRAMDEAGRWVCETFGCVVDRSGDEYFRTCPVDLGHNRIGLSIGGHSARRLCSLCGEDVSECEHLPGTAYLVPGGSADLGWCRVCGKEECRHFPGTLYRASVVSRIVEIQLAEVSLVGKPANPEARIHRLGIDPRDLREGLGPSFEPGMEIKCTKCLEPCDGLTRHDLTHG